MYRIAAPEKPRVCKLPEERTHAAITDDPIMLDSLAGEFADVERIKSWLAENEHPKHVDAQTPDFWATAIGLTQAVTTAKTCGSLGGLCSISPHECVAKIMQGVLHLGRSRYCSARSSMLWHPSCKLESRDARLRKTGDLRENVSNPYSPDDGTKLWQKRSRRNVQRTIRKNRLVYPST
jgi:hypothetical protein